MSAAAPSPSLQDRYLLTEGGVYLTGIQALVRMLLDQRRLDRARGLRTAGFVSGYEGSPLAGYDLELARHGDLLAEHDVLHRPALNEELAATAVQGSQLAAARPDARHDGVFGVWYGKAPGLDRATDALRHANLMGAHPAGGALALVGDDPVAKSSTVPSASERALADLGIPTLYPADSQDILDLGLHAIAMSRASGLWTALKLVTNVADGGGTVQVGADRVRPAMPEVLHAGRPYRHQVDGRLVGALPVAAEETAFEVRTAIAREYAARNRVNLLHPHGAADRVGIVAAGKTYLDVLQALRGLGLAGDDALARHGIRLLKLGMIYPLEPGIVAEFAAGLGQIVVVEEKRPFVETALKDLLYGASGAPRIVGKHDGSGAPLLRQTAELDVGTITAALSAVLELPSRPSQQSSQSSPSPSPSPSTPAPRARSAAAISRVSRLRSGPSMTVGAAASAARISARLVIDLEPGSATAASTGPAAAGAGQLAVASGRAGGIPARLSTGSARCPGRQDRVKRCGTPCRSRDLAEPGGLPWPRGLGASGGDDRG